VTDLIQSVTDFFVISGRWTLDAGPGGWLESRAAAVRWSDESRRALDQYCAHASPPANRALTPTTRARCMPSSSCAPSRRTRCVKQSSCGAPRRPSARARACSLTQRVRAAPSSAPLSVGSRAPCRRTPKLAGPAGAAPGVRPRARGARCDHTIWLANPTALATQPLHPGR
jgi:hypothetical protein